MSKILKTRIQHSYDSENKWNNTDFISKEGELYILSPDETYNYTRIKVGDGKSVVSELPLLKLNNRTSNEPSDTPTSKIDPPQNPGDLFYNRTSQSPEWNVDPTKVTISGHLAGTNPGLYKTKFTPNEGFVWKDTQDNRSIEIDWEIKKCVSSIYFVDGEGKEQELSTIEFNLGSTNQFFNFNYTDREYHRRSTSVASLDEDVAIPYVIDGFILEVTPGQSNGTATVTLSVEGDDYYTSASITITVVNKSVPRNLNNYSWNDIQKIAQDGLAKHAFNIGDTRTIALHGSIGDSLKLYNKTVTVFIIGFDYNGSENTIDFQFFGKNDINTQSTTYCLIDNVAYGKTGSLNDNNMYSNSFRMSLEDIGIDIDSRTYTWEGQLYNILGASKATNPDSKTFMSCIPELLRSCLVNQNVQTARFDSKQYTYTDELGQISPGDYYKNIEYSYTEAYLKIPSVSEISANYYVDNENEIGLFDNPLYEFYNTNNATKRLKTDLNNSTKPIIYWCRNGVEEWWQIKYGVYETNENGESIFSEKETAEGSHRYGVTINENGEPVYRSDMNCSFGVCPIFRIG